MKIISSMLLLLFTTNLFAQNKHSELYNQVEMICKTVLKSEMSTFNMKEYNQRHSQIIDSLKRNKVNYLDPSWVFYIYTISPLLLVDGLSCRDFAVLDTISTDSIHSIEIITANEIDDNFYSIMSTKGMIVIKTKRYSLADYFANTKKKKRRPKSNY